MSTTTITNLPGDLRRVVKGHLSNNNRLALNLSLIKNNSHTHVDIKKLFVLLVVRNKYDNLVSLYKKHKDVLQNMSMKTLIMLLSTAVKNENNKIVDFLVKRYNHVVLKIRNSPTYKKDLFALLARADSARKDSIFYIMARSFAPHIDPNVLSYIINQPYTPTYLNSHNDYIVVSTMRNFLGRKLKTTREKPENLSLINIRKLYNR